MVNAMVSTIEAILDAPDPTAEAEIVTTARRQLRMITLGVPQWRSVRAQAGGAAGRGSRATSPG